MTRHRPILSATASGLTLLALVAAGCGSSSDGGQVGTDKSGAPPAANTPGATTVGAKSHKPKSAPKGKKEKVVSGQARGGSKKGRGISPSAPSYIGLFTAKVAAADVAKLKAASGAAGQWTLVLGKTSYNLSTPKGAYGGHIKVAGSTMTFRDAKGCAQPQTSRSSAPQGRHPGQTLKHRLQQLRHQQTRASGFNGPRGVYKWTLKGRKLSFRAVSDPCAPRKAQLMALGWGQVQ